MTPLDAHTIKQAPVFASLTEDEAVGLGQAMHDELAQAGQVLFLEGEPGDRFYVVLDGRVEIVKALGTQEERLLSIRGPGDYFGEMSLLDPAGLRTATVRALTLPGFSPSVGTTSSLFCTSIPSSRTKWCGTSPSSCVTPTTPLSTICGARIKI